MNDTEGLIADALRLRAERSTPPPGPVLAALRRPRRTRKPLFLALATAATATAVAVAVTTVTAPRAADHQPPAVSLTATPEPVGAVSLEYSPTWLPDGFAERSRAVSAYQVQRGFEQGTSVLTFTVVIAEFASVTDRMAEAAAGNRTTVGGAPGFFLGDILYWRVSPERFLSLSPQGVPGGREVLERIAASVRPDPAPVRVPVSLKGGTEFTTYGTSADDWKSEASGEHDGRYYQATLEPADDTAGAGDSLKSVAMGREARFRPQDGVLVIRVTPDLQVRLHRMNGITPGKAAEPELVQVADHLTVDPDIDLGWFGP